MFAAETQLAEKEYGLVGGGGTPAAFAAFLARDEAIWIKVIATGGIKAE